MGLGWPFKIFFCKRPFRRTICALLFSHIPIENGKCHLLEFQYRIVIILWHVRFLIVFSLFFQFLTCSCCLKGNPRFKKEIHNLKRKSEEIQETLPKFAKLRQTTPNVTKLDKTSRNFKELQGTAVTSFERFIT